MRLFTRAILFLSLFNTVLCVADVQESTLFARIKKGTVSLRTRVGNWLLQNPQTFPIRPTNSEIEAGQSKVVNGLKNVEACHIRSSVQKQHACVWYALFNACAIQKLFEAGYPVEESAIQQYVEPVLVPWIEGRKEELLQRLELPELFNPINSECQERLATYLSLSNYHLVQIHRWLGVPATYYSRRQDEELEPFLQKCAGPYRCVMNIAGLLRGIMQKEAKLQHIILTVPADSWEGCHAVLISIFKRPNEKPLLFYMDSNNRTFESCELDYIVPYYALRFINELDAAAENVA